MENLITKIAEEIQAEQFDFMQMAENCEINDLYVDGGLQAISNIVNRIAGVAQRIEQENRTQALLSSECQECGE